MSALGGRRRLMCCSTVQLTALANGTASATSVPRGLAPCRASLPNIQAMPRPAAAIAIQVRGGKCWCRKLRANRAVTSGASAIVISTLATLVSVNATMKAVNITAQQMPEIQTLRGQSGSCRHMVGYALR